MMDASVSLILPDPAGADDPVGADELVVGALLEPAGVDD